MNKRYPLRHFSAFLFIALLAGCGGERCPSLPGGVRYCLRAPASGPTFSVLQEAVVGQGAHQETLLVQVENREDRLTLVGLSPLGQTLVSVTWDGKQIVSNGIPVRQPGFDPSLLLAVLQIAFWPQDEVRAGLPDNVIWEAGEEGGQLRRHDEPLMTVRGTGHRPVYHDLTIALPPAGLILNIRTLPDDGCCSTETSQ